MQPMNIVNEYCTDHDAYKQNNKCNKVDRTTLQIDKKNSCSPLRQDYNVHANTFKYTYACARHTHMDMPTQTHVKCMYDYSILYRTQSTFVIPSCVFYVLDTYPIIPYLVCTVLFISYCILHLSYKKGKHFSRMQPVLGYFCVFEVVLYPNRRNLGFYVFAITSNCSSGFSTFSALDQI